jgi:hypothetical protein
LIGEAQVGSQLLFALILGSSATMTRLQQAELGDVENHDADHL